MKHSHHTQIAADELGIEADPLQGINGGSCEDAVEQLLITAHNVPQFRGDGEDHMEVADRQQLRLSLCQPLLCVAAMARGAASVLAGVIGVMLMPALLAYPASCKSSNILRRNSVMTISPLPGFFGPQAVITLVRGEGVTV
jgi:hypothetical protein